MECAFRAYYSQLHFWVNRVVLLLLLLMLLSHSHIFRSNRFLLCFGFKWTDSKGNHPQFLFSSLDPSSTTTTKKVQKNLIRKSIWFGIFVVWISIFIIVCYILCIIIWIDLSFSLSLFNPFSQFPFWMLSNRGMGPIQFCARICRCTIGRCIVAAGSVAFDSIESTDHNQSRHNWQSHRTNLSTSCTTGRVGWIVSRTRRNGNFCSAKHDNHCIKLIFFSIVSLLCVRQTMFDHMLCAQSRGWHTFGHIVDWSNAIGRIGNGLWHSFTYIGIGIANDCLR